MQSNKSINCEKSLLLFQNAGLGLNLGFEKGADPLFAVKFCLGLLNYFHTLMKSFVAGPDNTDRNSLEQ